MSISTPTGTVELKGVPARRVYALSSGANPIQGRRISAVVGPLFDQLADNLRKAGVEPGSPAVAAYQGVDADGSSCQKIWAAYTIPDSAVAAPTPSGVDLIALPAVDRVASLTHYGPTATIGNSWMELWSWVEANGHTVTGLCREVYLRADGELPEDQWVTELQIPIESDPADSEG